MLPPTMFVTVVAIAFVVLSANIVAAAAAVIIDAYGNAVSTNESSSTSFGTCIIRAPIYHCCYSRIDTSRWQANAELIENEGGSDVLVVGVNRTADEISSTWG